MQVAVAATASQTEKSFEDGSALIKWTRKKRDEQRGCHVFFDESGMCVVSAKLRPEEGALLMKALDAVRQQGQTYADALVEVATRRLAASEQTAPSCDDRFHVVVHADATSDDCTVEARGERVGISAEIRRRLTCDATIAKGTRDDAGAVIDVGRKTRRISTTMRLALVERDGGCRFPGCTNRFTQAHHVKHWSDDGETKLTNLVLLCGFHHSFIHNGKALLGEDQIFRDLSGREITATSHANSQPLPSAPRDALPIPFNQLLDLDWTLAVMHPKARSQHNAASEVREAW